MALAAGQARKVQQAEGRRQLNFPGYARYFSRLLNGDNPPSRGSKKRPPDRGSCHL